MSNMKHDTIKTLAKEASEELSKDADRLFDGEKEFAAQYVYFKAVREGRIDAGEDKREDRLAIVEIARAM